jgi:type III secretion protein Q
VNDAAGTATRPSPPTRSEHPRLSAAQQADLNLILGRGVGIPFRALDLDLELSFTADLPGGKPALSIGLAIDGAPLAVFLEDFFFVRALEPLLPDAALASAPPALRAAAIEVALAELMDSFERATGRKVAVVTAEDGAGGGEDGPRLGFVLREPRGADRVRGWIRADARALALVAGLLKDRPPVLRAPPDDLPVPIRLEIGATLLPQADLAALQPQDIILVENCFLTADDSLILRLSPRLAWKAKIEAAAIIVTQQVKDTMAQGAAERPGPEPGKPGEKAGGKASEKAGGKPPEPQVASLDEIEINLVFELGERLLTLAEIRAIDKGYVFDLGKDWRHAVAIRANGRLIGSGELIEVEDRLGVRVIELAGRR